MLMIDDRRENNILKRRISQLELACRELETELGKGRNPNNIGIITCHSTNLVVIFQCVEIHNYLARVGPASTMVIGDKLGLSNGMCGLRMRKLKDAGWINSNTFRRKAFWAVSSKMIGIVDANIGYLREVNNA